MFYFYNNAKNIVVEEGLNNLIKVLEIEGNRKVCKWSIHFMKMLACVISIADGVA